MSKDYYIQIDEDTNNYNSKPKITLPSEKEKNNKKKLKKLSPYIKTFKYSSIISFIILIYLFYVPILLYISSLLKSNPTFFYYYSFVKTQITNNTILGLGFASILGSIFFLAIPSEALFIYFLNSTNYNFLLIIVIMVIGNLFGLIFNYGFGRLMGKRVLKFLFKEKKFYNYQEKIDTIGGYILFFGNIFPGPFEVLSVFYGGFKYNFKIYIFLSFIGRLIKYTLLFIAFHFYWVEINYYWILTKSFFGF